MTLAARLFATWVALAVLALAPRAVADDLSPAANATPATPLSLSATPLLGTGSPLGDGWFQIELRLRSLIDTPLEGEVELLSELSWSRNEERVRTRAPFALAPHGAVSLLLPSHGFGSVPPTLRAIARTRDGQPLAELDLPTPGATAPFLFVLDVPNRLGAWLRGTHLPASSRDPHSHAESLELMLASARTEASTGDPVVPDLAAGYASATVVLGSTSVLARLGERSQRALADWLLAGGCLAVAIDRPEDRRDPFLRALLGAEPLPRESSADLRRERLFEVIPEDSNEGPLLERAARPSPALAATLTAYEGGNLRPTPWGASATYGLGELHLLAFDPQREPAVSDPWTHLSLTALVRHAWDRRIHVALPHAATNGNDHQPIRRLLDPNQRTRWAVVVAALLLLAYSVLAGPLNFHLAARRGRPLRALALLPLWSLLTLVLVVGLGLFAKGVRGQVRHLGLIEAGAGMSRGAVTRFRGFYAPSSRERIVRARADGNVLDVADPGRDPERVVVVDREGPRLERFQSKPWQTMLVREEGFVELAGGVTLREQEGRLLVRNRLGRDLVGVLVRLPDERTFYFPRIADGARVEAERGEPLATVGFSTGLGTRLDVPAFAAPIDRDEPGSSALWNALSSYCPYGTDWWPSEVPVLIGQIVGGAGEMTDSGLALVQDRLLIRVVGQGGEP